MIPKFRAFHKKDKKIYDIHTIDFEKKWVFFTDSIGEDKKDFDEIIFLQFTGLSDKNGVELYAGDLVKPPTTPGSTFEGVVSEVKWSEEKGQWYLCPLDTTPDYPLCNHHDSVEKIGTIHEHPELLK